MRNQNGCFYCGTTTDVFQDPNFWWRGRYICVACDIRDEKW